MILEAKYITSLLRLVQKWEKFHSNWFDNTSIAIVESSLFKNYANIFQNKN